jgi:hypothetical protein
MRDLHRWCIGIAALSVLWMASSCIFAERDAWVTEYRQITVDSLRVPDSLSSADTLVIQFYGAIGYDGWWKFWRFDAARDSHEVRVSLWAKARYLKHGGCPSNVPLLSGKEFHVAPLYPGTFRVVALQPDRSKLIDSVVVTDGR